MPNSQQIVSWVASKTLSDLLNETVIANGFYMDHREDFNKQFADAGGGPGAQIRVPYPTRLKSTDGLVAEPQAVNQLAANITIDQVFNVSVQTNSMETALNMNQDWVQDKIVTPMKNEILQQIESRSALFAYRNTSQIAGVLGTSPTDSNVIQTAHRIMKEQGMPAGGRQLILAPSQAETISNGMTSLFNPNSDISDIIREGNLGKLRGFKSFESASLYYHTAGSWAGAVTVNGANQQAPAIVQNSTTQSQSLNINCTNGDTFNANDVFGIALVFPANPQTRRRVGSGASTGTRQFRIVNDVVATGTTATLTISPPIYGPGSAYQNVTALPADTAALTLFPGTSSPGLKSGVQGLAYHKQAFGIAGVKLPEFTSVKSCKSVQDPKTGLAFSVMSYENPTDRTMGFRADIAFGFANFYADYLSVRVLGA